MDAGPGNRRRIDQHRLRPYHGDDQETGQVTEEKFRFEHTVLSVNLRPFRAGHVLLFLHKVKASPAYTNEALQVETWNANSEADRKDLQARRRVISVERQPDVSIDGLASLPATGRRGIATGPLLSGF